MNTSASPRDCFFDPWLVPRTSKAHALVDAVAEIVEAWERDTGIRQRARRQEDHRAFLATVHALVASLADAHLRRPWAAVVVPLRKATRVKMRKEGKAPAEVVGEALPALVDSLAAPAVGLVVKQKGAHSEGRAPTLRVTGAFAALVDSRGVTSADFGRRQEQEVLVLRAPKDARNWTDGNTAARPGESLVFFETSTTRAMREEMHALNDWLEAADLSLAPGAPGNLDPSARHLRRIFHADTSRTVRWDRGGRIFGGFWQGMKAEERLRFLRIEGVPVVVLDWRQAFIRVAYGEARVAPPEGDLYAIADALPRDAAKATMGALLCAPKMLARLPQGVPAMLTTRMRWAEVRRLVEAKHGGIAHLFGTGFGFTAMHRESCALLRALSVFRARGVVALPIHDAVAVKADHAEEARAVMEAAFADVVGVPGPTSTDCLSVA